VPISTHHIDASPDAPRLARRWVTDLLARWRRGPSATAGLLTSELVADAVRRSSTSIEVRVDLGSDSVRVDVGDGDGGLVMPADDDDVERAVRRRLVDGLARAWGSDGGRDRTGAWFELAA